MAEKLGKYIYCIVKTDKAESFGNIGIGENKGEVNMILYNNIAAVVSDSPIIEYRVSRNNMMTHETVIEKVMAKYTVLPVKFGTIAENNKKIGTILEDNYKKFADLLKYFDDKKELGLKAIFLDNIFTHILEKYKDIASLKETIASKPPEKTHHQRARIGEMVQNALENEKTIVLKKIMDGLKPLSVEMVENKTYGDKMIINGAFLIIKKQEPEFDIIINKLDKEYGSVVKLKYVACVPPFNFVNLEIKT